MTAITDFSTQHDIGEAPHMVDGASWMTRGAQSVGGIALVLAAIGLWITPGAAFDPDLALIKLGVSATLILMGLAIIQAGWARPMVEVEIDTVRREVRLMRGKGRARSLVSRTSIADLGPAEVRGNMARLWTTDGSLVAEVAMSDPDLRRSLMGALRDAGKI
ncbi:hypothetical protein [uncultured Tateyamaria sp.]|uniref:hypothetical protein n=1 Tax=uncultured Tateyamaria sp. TaxID=455651 RepID=UPI0026266D3F|nr:hypothetical protein [uncultured Tateyamaria sp.]